MYRRQTTYSSCYIWMHRHTHDDPLLPCKARQGKTRQDKTRQDKTRQGKARQGKARQGKTTQDHARQGKTRPRKARPRKTVVSDCYFIVNIYIYIYMHRCSQGITPSSITIITLGEQMQNTVLIYPLK